MSRRSTPLLVLGSLLLCAGAIRADPPPPPQALSHAQSLTIDNFTAAPQELAVLSGNKSSDRTARACDRKSSPSSQSPLGCRRLVFLHNNVEAASSGFAAPGTLKIGNGRLLISSAIKNFARLEVFYADDLDLDLSSLRRFRIHFDSSDVGLNINMQMIARNNPSPALGGLNIDGVATGTPFVVDIPFTSFGVNAGELPDLRHIRQIRLFVQSASAIGANDYAMTLIEAVP